jgi:hypothetical protein
MDKLNMRQFHASMRSRAGLGVGIVLAFWLGITEVVETGLRHRLNGAMWIVVGVYLGWCLLRSFCLPVLVLGQDSVDFCTVYNWKVRTVQRSNVDRIMWQKAALMRFFSRDGKGAEIRLSSLGREDRAEVRKYLQEAWGLEGVAI